MNAFASLALLVFGVGLVSAACPPGFEVHGSYCYNFPPSGHKLSWFDAKKACENVLGHLAIANDDSELRYLQDSARRRYTGSVWLGATAIVSPRNFRWITDQSPVALNGWASGEPNFASSKEFFLELWSGRDFDLNDNSYDKRQNYICEATP